MPSNDRQKDTARPRFYKDAIKNNAKSEKEGRPIFDEKEMVHVVLPGDRLMDWVGEVTEAHKLRWPEQYAAFKRGEERAASGTPIEQWPNANLTVGRVAEIKAMNILSVEELANIPDSVLPKLGMGARELREQARTYLESAHGSAETSSMAAEIARLKEMVERLAGDKQPEAKPTETTVAQEKSLEDCTDVELKDYIKRETGSAPRGKVTRETLLKQAAEIATSKEAA